MEGQLSRKAEFDGGALPSAATVKTHELFMHRCFGSRKLPHVLLHLNRDYDLELGPGRQHLLLVKAKQR